MKYNYDIKLKAVLSIKKGILIPEPYNKIGRHWRDKVRLWEKIYDVHGKEGLKHKYIKHNVKDRIRVIKEIINGKSMQAVAVIENISIKAISNWYKIYRQEGINGLKLLNERSSVMLRKEKNVKNKINSNAKKNKFTDEEIEYILAENAYLKKLHALVQEENQKQNKK